MNGKELRIEYMETGSLRPYDKNAKEHPARQVDQIAASIREFGFRQPIVVDGEGLVIAGHGRLLAAKQLGMERVPCVRADDLTEAQVRALRLADNKTNESEWIKPLLDEELAALAGEIDMGMFGFDLGGTDDAEDGEIREDEPPMPPEEPEAKPGDIYRLGRHRLMCGDSTDPEAVAKLTDGAVMDLLLTDPPYNVDLGSVRTPTRSNTVPIKNDNMEEGEFIGFLTRALENAKNHMRGGCGMVHLVCRTTSHRV